MAYAAENRETDPILELTNTVDPAYAHILTEEALRFVGALENAFGERRQQLLDDRMKRQARYDAGELPDFLPETRDIRSGDWAILNTPEDLRDRRVEITGPVDRKMMINAFNSGANVFMADFEDASSPTWTNMLDGQVNMYDYARGTLEFTDPKTGKHYSMGEKTAVLKVRPRGWHMEEAHATLNGKPVSAGLFDFGLYVFHNAKALMERGTAAYFLSAQDGKPPGGQAVG